MPKLTLEEMKEKNAITTWKGLRSFVSSHTAKEMWKGRTKEEAVYRAKMMNRARNAKKDSKNGVFLSTG